MYEELIQPFEEKFIPALSDGSADALGNPIGVLGAGNDRTFLPCEVKLIQAAGQGGDLGHSSLWYEADETTEKKVSYSDGKAWVSGTDNTFVDFYTDSSGICIGRMSVILARDRVLTEAEYNQIVGRFPNSCGGGVVPF